MHRAVVFDLDGTLIDTMTDIAHAMDATLSHFGEAPLGVSGYQGFIGGGSKSMAYTLCPNGTEPEQMYQHYLSQYEARLLNNTKPYPGIEACLAHLQAQQIPMAVVTNKHQEQAEVLLAQLFPNIQFAAIFGYREGMAKKPDPASTHAALEAMAVTAAQTMYVGDTQTDMQTADNAGVTPVFVTWGYGQQSEQGQCQRCISEPMALLDLLPSATVEPDMNTAQVNNATQLIPKIIAVIQGYLAQVEGDQFAPVGARLLEQNIESFVSNHEPLQFILPGFPCKSPNQKSKSFSRLPDYGEVIAIERLDRFCADLREVYSPGAEVVILSDGTTFNDVVQVSSEDKNAYRQALRTLTVTENIQWRELPDIIPNLSAEAAATLKDEDIRQKLEHNLTRGKGGIAAFIKEVKKSPSLMKTHDKLCSYLYYDVNLELFSDGDRDAFLASIADKAHMMMFRGKALSHAIEGAFPRHIRLSVHQYNNEGPKFTFALAAQQNQSVSPWHTVPVRTLAGNYILLPHSLALEKQLVLVKYAEHNWLYMEVADAQLQQFEYEVVKAPKFGLQVTPIGDVSPTSISSEILSQWAAEFGFVVLKQAGFSQQEQLVTFAESFGEIYHWKFGPLKVVQPEANPDGFVMSMEKTPLHWDLSMLPKDTPQVQDNPRFCANQFLLYCKTPPAAGEGQTTLVDSRTALKLAGHEKVQQWKATDVTYHTKMTYFGGDPHTYPMVYSHPVTGEDLFRYQEGSDSALQTFSLSSEEMSQEALTALVEDAQRIAYDPRCLVAYEWSAEDLVIIDNYHTLHGRLAMTSASAARELWRVQVL